MKGIHKIYACVTFLFVFFIAYCFEARVTDTVAQSLVMFFSVVFGFYMTCVAVLYSSSYLKFLHERIEKDKRGTHILRDYILTSSYLFVVSIVFIIGFSAVATKNNTGILSANFSPLTVPSIKYELDLNLLLTSGIFGISAVNIYCMILLITTIVDGMIEEAKK